MKSHNFKDSAMLASASYDDASSELTVTFTNGKSYTYTDVPASTYDELVAAPSAGRFFNSIKNFLVLK